MVNMFVFFFVGVPLIAILIVLAWNGLNLRLVKDNEGDGKDIRRKIRAASGWGLGIGTLLFFVALFGFSSQ